MTGKKALIVWGGWEGHRPQECACLFVPFLEGEGYEVDMREGLQAFSDRDLLQGVDLIVPSYSMAPMSPEQEGGLLDAISAGVGLACWHGAATISGAPSYALMLGGQFVVHPRGMTEYRVTVTSHDDPITGGLDGFAVHSEQYYMHVDPSNEVLAVTHFSGEEMPGLSPVMMPVVWKRRWGKGRVFYSSLGHAPEDFDVPAIRAITRRGMLWASR